MSSRLRIVPLNANPKTEPGARDGRGKRLPQIVMPGMDHSARQAAQARGAKIAPRKPQKEPGGLFVVIDEPDADLFGGNPRKRQRKSARARKTAKGLPPPARRRKRRARAGAVKIVRRRRNAYTTHRGLESGRDLDFATRMRIARLGAGGEERYLRHMSRVPTFDEDPLDAAFPVNRRHAKRATKWITTTRRAKLYGYIDHRDGKFHPIRNSPGYDPTMTTNPAHARRRRRKPCFVIEAGHKGGTSFWDGRSFTRSKARAKKFHHAGDALNTAKAINAPARFLWWRVVPQ